MENTNQEQNNTDQETGTSISNSDIRKSELFQKVTSEQQSKLDATMAELEALKKSITDAKESDRIKQLEDEKNYKQIIEENSQKLKAAEDAYKASLRQYTLRDEFRKQNVNDEYFLEYHLGKYNGPAEDIENYVKGLMDDESTSRYFGQIEQGPKGQSLPRTAAPGTRSTSTDWAQIKRDLDNPAKAVEADKIVRDYFDETGKMPPGF